MAQLTLKTGFRRRFYLDQVGADYYLTASGNRLACGWAPAPGIWA